MLDISDLRDIILSEKFVWQEKETRPELFQYNFYMNFHYVYDIDKKYFVNNKYYNIIKHSDDSISKLINPIINKIEKQYNKKLYSVYFVKLKSQQYPLRQYHELLEYSKEAYQCYIPIVINEKCNVCTENEIVVPEPGQDFFIKDDDLLAIYNFGDTDAIYLVIDLLP